ncbi:hypothetical protein G7046_g7372 [Stylonectria norvegica]|nr:hypothetical protein G7046_g7372 [Stylonectria norvegica]
MADGWSRDIQAGSSSTSSQGFDFDINSTAAAINDLEFAAAKSARTSLIVLASLNVAAAFVTAVGILWESRQAAKKSTLSRRLRLCTIGVVGPAEVFPFILSCGIVFQGIVFAAAQSKGLEALLILGCALTSQLMLPVVIVTMLAIAAVVISVNLRKDASIQVTERLAASRMVYFLVVAVVSNIFLIPFFFSLSFSDPRTSGAETLQLSMVAGVVANLSGFTNGGLYLYLRSSKAKIIGPREGLAPKTREIAKGVRVWAPSRSDSIEGLVEKTKDEEHRIDSPKWTPTYKHYPKPFGSNDGRSSEEPPRTPKPAQISGSSTPKNYSTKPSYSIFPSTDDISHPKAALHLPTPTYIPSSSTRLPYLDLVDDILPPPLIPSLSGAHHRRDSSIVSSATVQIGLRFSNINDMGPLSATYHRDSGAAQAYANQPAGRSRLLSPLITATTNSLDEKDHSHNTERHDLGIAPAASSTSLHETVAEDSGKGVTLSPTVYIPQEPQSRLAGKDLGLRLGTSRPPRQLESGSPRTSHDEPEVRNMDWI